MFQSKITDFVSHKQAIQLYFEGVFYDDNLMQVNSDTAEGSIYFLETKSQDYFVCFDLEIKQEISYNIDYSKATHFDRVASFFNNNVLLDLMDNDLQKEINLDGFYSSPKTAQVSGILSPGDRLQHTSYFHSLNLFQEIDDLSKRSYLMENPDLLIYLDNREELRRIQGSLLQIPVYPPRIQTKLFRLKMQELKYIFLNRLFQLETDHERLDGLEAYLNKSLIEIKLTIDRDPRIRPNIEELASEFGIHKNNLQRGFKTLFGSSIYNYYTWKRLEAAKGYLIDHSAKISGVCYEYGYTDLQHFSKQFKKQFGMSPKKYLEQYKQGH